MMTRDVRATVKSYKCDNPNHQHGCGLGWHLIECAEDDAHTWLASIVVNGTQLWGSNQIESQSREAATQALLKRLAEGLSVS